MEFWCWWGLWTVSLRVDCPENRRQTWKQQWKTCWVLKVWPNKNNSLKTYTEKIEIFGSFSPIERSFKRRSQDRHKADISTIVFLHTRIHPPTHKLDVCSWCPDTFSSHRNFSTFYCLKLWLINFSPDAFDGWGIGRISKNVDHYGGKPLPL